MLEKDKRFYAKQYLGVSLVMKMLLFINLPHTMKLRIIYLFREELNQILWFWMLSLISTKLGLVYYSNLKWSLFWRSFSFCLSDTYLKDYIQLHGQVTGCNFQQSYNSLLVNQLHHYTSTDFHVCLQDYQFVSWQTLLCVYIFGY